MTQKEIQDKVKATVMKELLALYSDKAEQYADNAFAVPVDVEGEKWAKVTVVCGQLKDTKTAKKFDPFVAQSEWQVDKDIKKKLADEKAKLKAEKLAKKSK